MRKASSIEVALLGACLLLSAAPALAAPKSVLRLRGQLATRWELADEAEGWTNDFVLRRARADARWDLGKLLRAVVELEARDGVELKDAYARLALHPVLQLTAGHFKKPFSRLRLTSLWRVPVPDRGLLDEYAIGSTDHGGFGGRDIGAMLSGTCKPLARLRYFIGGFSSPGIVRGRTESHQDIVGRLELRPFKGLRLAAHANHKRYYLGERALGADMVGGDARYTYGPFRLELEGAYGANVDLGEGHHLWGAHGIVSYKLPLTRLLGRRMRLWPAAMVEAFDPDDRVAGGRAWRFSGALNLELNRLVRLTASGEHSWGEPRVSDPEQEGKVVPLQTETRMLLQLYVLMEWSSKRPHKAKE